eukprot:m.114508 g.114508  ORF g.114508 m.114508 type:complete len:167 (-) comp28356_c1_seq2:279-779(-)
MGVIGLWRNHFVNETTKGKSTMHLVTATNWKDNTTYTTSVTDVLFGDNGLPNPGGVEDGFLYVDENGHCHGLFHMLHPAHPYSSGGHAFSKDCDAKWTWTGRAYDGNMTFSDGTKTQIFNGDRPKFIFDKSGTKPIALTTGAGGTNFSAPGMDADQSYTLLRPLVQ